MIRSFASSIRKKKQIGREERTEGEKKLKGEGVRKGEGDRKPKSDGVANEKACQQTKRKGNDPWVTRKKKKKKKRMRDTVKY